jgi:hypothetical protein
MDCHFRPMIPSGRLKRGHLSTPRTHARRQYDVVDPDNRLAAGELERRWNDRLAAVAQIEDQIRSMCCQQPSAVSDDERTMLLALAEGLPVLWNHPAALRRDAQADFADRPQGAGPGRLLARHDEAHHKFGALPLEIPNGAAGQQGSRLRLPS